MSKIEKRLRPVPPSEKPGTPISKRFSIRKSAKFGKFIPEVKTIGKYSRKIETRKSQR